MKRTKVLITVPAISSTLQWTPRLKLSTARFSCELVKKYNIPATFKFIFTVFVFSSCKIVPLVHVVYEKLMLALTA